MILHFTCHQFGNATLENSGRGSQFVYFDPQRYKMRNSRTNTSAFSCIKMDWSLNEFKPQSVARPRASCIELGRSFSSDVPTWGPPHVLQLIDPWLKLVASEPRPMRRFYRETLLTKFAEQEHCYCYLGITGNAGCSTINTL